MIHHVLIPLDGSQLAETALPVARQVLKPNGHITLVNALTNGSDSPDSASDAESTLPRTDNFMNHIAQDLRIRGYEVDVEIVPGQPADVILHLAEKLRADMVVMSTHGRSGLSRVLFGSITLKVLGECLIPVLVVPNRQREEAAETEVKLGPSLAT